MSFLFFREVCLMGRILLVIRVDAKEDEEKQQQQESVSAQVEGQ